MTQRIYCLIWARKNLAAVAAWMVMFGQLKNNISHLNESKCLLAKPDGNYYLMSNAQADLWGCYLFWDDVECKWIRSGKATGEGGIRKRNTQHKKRAEADENPDKMALYYLYPSAQSIRSKYGGEDGMFEDLIPYIPVAFSGDAAASIACCFEKDYCEGEVFFYTTDEKEAIEKTNFRGKAGVQKHMEMGAYLFELGYELAMSLSDNVSSSPGLEGCGLRRIDD